MSKHTEAAGGAQAKTGENLKALDRASGYGATVSAVESKTRSRYHSGGTAYHYVGVSGYGDNENIKGYDSGG